MIPDLLPISAYVTKGMSWRTALVMAVLWGVPMTLLVVFTSGLPIAVALASGAIAAFLFGGLWTIVFGRSVRRMITRLYAADPKLVPAPPSGAYAIRILGSLMISPRFAIGGHMYAGPTELVFVPHKRNRAKDRGPRVLQWAHVERVESVTRPVPTLARIFSSSPLTYVAVASHEGDWLLGVPESNTVAAELQKFLTESARVVQQ